MLVSEPEKIMATKIWPDEPPTITETPGIMGGMPCVSGTRVPAETILDSINHDASIYDIFAAYPYLPFGAVEAVVEWALANDRVITVPLPVRRVPVGGFGRARC